MGLPESQVSLLTGQPTFNWLTLQDFCHIKREVKSLWYSVTKLIVHFVIFYHVHIKLMCHSLLLLLHTGLQYFVNIKLHVHFSGFKLM